MHPIATRLSAAARKRRAGRLLDLIAEIVAARGRCRIIDLGGEVRYWQAFDQAKLRLPGVSILCVNLQAQVSEDPFIDVLQGDACRLPQFEDGAFDLAHSNSVIEHVGEWSNMEAFAGELRRLAPFYYVQTPYFWFPIEPHFLAPIFHWLPEPMRIRAMLRRGHGHHPRETTVAGAVAAVRSARLLDKTAFRSLFPDADHEDERVLGLVKSLIAVRGG
ncbi:class I SAM-dependent methyltransferase [Phenylobacterium sp. VNQ135]|uniref:class I SAM-dependent methyltransferase n=1 Tax=Phenylobacterium sp. VNQ135 TaxID=3400922 RepID=UPI003BFE46F1